MVRTVILSADFCGYGRLLEKRQAHSSSFIHTRDSGPPLRISHPMFCFLLSYLQVMPSFLDIILPFAEAADPHFTGSRGEESVVDLKQPSPKFSQVGLSARRMQVCYNLGSTEQFPTLEGKWHSIHQTAVYHTFDFDTGKSVWIISGNDSAMKERPSRLAETWASSRFGSVVDAFTASLQTHLLLCDLSLKHWRNCIDTLEAYLRDLTRNALPIGADRTPSRNPEPTTPPRTPGSGVYDESMAMAYDKSVLDGNAHISGLERILIVEEKLLELLQVLRLNIEVAEELRRYYAQVTNTNLPVEFARKCEPHIKRFEGRVRRVEKNLQFQYFRTETLMRLLSDNKTFVRYPTTFLILMDHANRQQSF
jgi:hypothetical protein